MIDHYEKFLGEVLEQAIYVHPIYKNTLNNFTHGDHVKATKGTGFVHTAPAHGPDDFLVSIKNKIPRVKQKKARFFLY